MGKQYGEAVLPRSAESAAHAYLAFEPSRCTECRACELACSFLHDQAFNRRRARLRVETAWPDAPRLAVCVHCAEPACVEACPVGALRRVEGRVELEADDCIGCGACQEACPEGAIFMAPGYAVVHKCDACPEAECVSVCSPRALTRVEGGDRR
jgi:Fe-S-cluster-containing dehydrogenase component